jgi:hypothetical protein
MVSFEVNQERIQDRGQSTCEGQRRGEKVGRTGEGNRVSVLTRGLI